MPPRKKSSQQRQWRRVDLHLHTPASADYKQPNVTYLDFLGKVEEKALDIIAFTDHNTATGYARFLEEVESLELLERLNRLREDERKRLVEYRRLREKILILPGFEFTATLGFHILGIFPPETTVRELEHLLLSLRVPPEKLDQGSGEVGATTDALTAYRMINEAGGLAIAAHANSSHGVAMPGFDFGGQTRIAYTQDTNLHALEVTDLDSKSRRRTAAFFSGTKPEYPRRMHCIQGSDAHKLIFDPKFKNEMGVGDRATEILLDDLSFDAIKDVFLGNDFARTRPYRPATEEPFDPIRAAREQGDTLVQAFHERLHEKRGVARSILEDVTALANTNGGIIYIGASANARAAVVGMERPEQAMAEMRSAISKEITPPLEVQIDVLKSQGKNVLQVIVPRGSEAPYALEGSYIYVRSENETGLAMRDEIVQLVRDALAVEFAASAAVPASTEKRPSEEEAAPAEPVEGIVPKTVLPVEPPRTGVEIVSSEVRKGVTYYSVRDLRNARVVQNVTRASARRLWQYAIEEQEKYPCDREKVAWVDNIGICKRHKRGGKVRYDLVQRAGDKLFVYYGVTEDGIHGAWRKLVEGEKGAEMEEAPEGLESETRAEISPPLEIATEFETAARGENRSGMAPGVEAPREDSVSPQMDKPTLVESHTAEPTPEVAVALPAPVSHQVSPKPRMRGDESPREEATPKTRAQEWREILDRAIAEARAAQQAERSLPEESAAPTSQINAEEAVLAEDRAAAQGETRTSEIVQSEEHASDVTQMAASEEKMGSATD
jgi:hypothetical protein